MYLAPNFIFNKDPKESLGFLLSEDDESQVRGYLVNSPTSTRDIDLRLDFSKRIPLGKPRLGGGGWYLGVDGKIKKD